MQKYDPLRPTEDSGNPYQPKVSVFSVIAHSYFDEQPGYGQKRANERPRSPGHVAPPKRATPIDEDYRIAPQQQRAQDPRMRTQSNPYEMKRDEMVPSTIDKYLKSSMSKDDILAKLKQDLFQKEQPPLNDALPPPPVPQQREDVAPNAPPPRLFGGSHQVH